MQVVRAVALGFMLAAMAPVGQLSAKELNVAQGQKALIAFTKCTDAWWCHTDMCIEIKKSDGSSGRAHLFSEWEPGRSHDLDVHDGQYCDKLDLYFFMAYYLYAVPDTNVTFTIGNEIAPK